VKGYGTRSAPLQNDPPPKTGPSIMFLLLSVVPRLNIRRKYWRIFITLGRSSANSLIEKQSSQVYDISENLRYWIDIFTFYPYIAALRQCFQGSFGEHL